MLPVGLLPFPHTAERRPSGAVVVVKPKEVVSLRTGPLVYRGANVSRAVHGVVPAISRASSAPKLPPIQCQPFSSLPRPRPEPILESSCLHQKCRLPINLREFLSEQLGSTLHCDSDTILTLAANADQITLSK